jgi:hypothetical protein
MPSKEWLAKKNNETFEESLRKLEQVAMGYIAGVVKGDVTGKRVNTVRFSGCWKVMEMKDKRLKGTTTKQSEVKEKSYEEQVKNG